jgi:hypothetical protein
MARNKCNALKPEIMFRLARIVCMFSLSARRFHELLPRLASVMTGASEQEVAQQLGLSSQSCIQDWTIFVCKHMELKHHAAILEAALLGV